MRSSYEEKNDHCRHRLFGRRIMSGKLWKYGGPGVAGVERKRICSHLSYAPNGVTPSFEHDKRHAAVCADEPAPYQRFMDALFNPEGQ